MIKSYAQSLLRLPIGNTDIDLYIILSMLKHAMFVTGTERASVFYNATLLSVELATEDVLEIRASEEGWDLDSIRDGEQALATLRDKYLKKVLKILRPNDLYVVKVADFRLTNAILYLGNLYNIACDEIDIEIADQQSVRMRGVKRLPPPSSKLPEH